MTMTAVDVVAWPSIRDVVRELDVSPTRVTQLIHGQQLSAVRTRLGWLVDPESVRAYEASRALRAARKAARAS